MGEEGMYNHAGCGGLGALGGYTEMFTSKTELLYEPAGWSWGQRPELLIMALCLRRAGSGLGLSGLPESLCSTQHSFVDLEKQVEPSLGPRGMASGSTIQSILSKPFSKVRDGPDRPIP